MSGTPYSGWARFPMPLLWGYMILRSLTFTLGPHLIGGRAATIGASPLGMSGELLARTATDRTANGLIVVFGLCVVITLVSLVPMMKRFITWRVHVGAAISFVLVFWIPQIYWTIFLLSSTWASDAATSNSTLQSLPSVCMLFIYVMFLLPSSIVDCAPGAMARGGGQSRQPTSRQSVPLKALPFLFSCLLTLLVTAALLGEHYSRRHSFEIQSVVWIAGSWVWPILVLIFLLKVSTTRWLWALQANLLRLNQVLTPYAVFSVVYLGLAILSYESRVPQVPLRFSEYLVVLVPYCIVSAYSLQIPLSEIRKEKGKKRGHSSFSIDRKIGTEICSTNSCDGNEDSPP